MNPSNILFLTPSNSKSAHLNPGVVSNAPFPLGYSPHVKATRSIRGAQGLAFFFFTSAIYAPRIFFNVLIEVEHAVLVAL